MLFTSISQNIKEKIRHRPCLVNLQPYSLKLHWQKRCVTKVFVEILYFYYDLFCKPTYSVNQAYRHLLPQTKSCSDYSKSFKFGSQVAKFSPQKPIMENFVKFTRKHLLWCFFYVKLQEKVNKGTTTLKKAFMVGISLRILKLFSKLLLHRATGDGCLHTKLCSLFN